MDKTYEDWFDEITGSLKHTNRRKYQRLRRAFNDLIGRSRADRPGVMKALEHGEDILGLIRMGPVEDPWVLANMAPIITSSKSAALPSAYWLELLTPSSLAQDFLANLEELYVEKWVSRYGPRRARLLWLSQCMQFAFGYWGPEQEQSEIVR